MNNGEVEYRFIWFIENFSYCSSAIVSPAFTAEGLEGTVCRVRLHPRGTKEKDRYIAVGFERSLKKDGKKKWRLQYQVAFLAADGSVLNGRQNKSCFETKEWKGPSWTAFVEADEVFSRRRADYLPNDTLTVSCRVRKGEGKVCKIEHTAARTRLGIENISFLHLVEGFSRLEPVRKNTAQFQYHSEKGCVLSSHLYINESPSGVQKIEIEVTPPEINHILSKCKISSLGRSGNVIRCGEEDIRFDKAKEKIVKIPLRLTMEEISRLKRDDALYLLCECTFYTGVEFEKIEETLLEMPFLIMEQISSYLVRKSSRKTSKKQPTAFLSVSEDMKVMYDSKSLADIEVKTKTKSFPAHKMMLCARSPVFSRMLSSDMQEKNTNTILVCDLEDDVVEHFLRFIYSDRLETDRWETVSRLYYAADKYQMEKLKVMCTSVLVENLNTSTASEVLLLADRHNDSDLKVIVEDFILEHQDQVFATEEWGKLAEANYHLFVDTILLKYKRKYAEN